MKFRFILAALILITASSIAQTDTNRAPIQTVFGKPQHIGWWISPDFAYTQLSNRDAWLGGMSGGVILDHSFSIGVAGYGIMNSNSLVYSNVLDTANVYLYGGYGGLKLEYRLWPLKMINIAFPLLIGGGGVGYSTWNWNHDYYYDDPYHDHHHEYYSWDGFFVLEPGVTVGINLLRFMRLDVGASYRWAPSVNLPSTSRELTDGFNATMALRFGGF